MLHGKTCYEEAIKNYRSLVRWLSEKNYEAKNSLEESKMLTLTIIKLKTRELLRKSLKSTNPIESVFQKVRDKSYRVKNWKSGSDQICRWSAAILTESWPHRNIIINKTIKSVT